MVHRLLMALLGRWYHLDVEGNVVVHVSGLKPGDIADIIQQTFRCMRLGCEAGGEGLAGEPAGRQCPGERTECHMIRHGPEPGGISAASEVCVCAETVMD